MELGILVAIVAFVLAPLAIVRMPIQWTVAFVLVGWWPLSFFAKESVGALLSLAGIVLWGQLLLQPRPRTAIRGWGRNGTYFAVMPWVLGTYALTASVFGTDLATSFNRAVVLFCLAIPMYIAGARYADEWPHREVRWLGGALVLILVVNPATPLSNPILIGHAMWLTVAAVALRPMRPAALKIVVIVAALNIMVATGKVGPLVAAGIVTLLFVFHRSDNPRLDLRRRLRPRSLLRLRVLGLALLPFIFVIGSNKYAEKRAVRTVRSNSVALRSAGYRQVVRDFQLTGHGLESIDIAESGIDDVNLGYAHNFLLDAGQVAGIVGIVTVGPLLVMSMYRALRVRTPETSLAMGLLASVMFSGGIETPHGWFAIGILLASARGPSESIRSGTANI